MYCDNCGNAVDDDAAFCPKCGQSLMPGKVPSDVPAPRRAVRRQKTQDNLCFGEEDENPYAGGIFFIFVAIFLFVIFFVPDFPVEALIVLAFFVVGVLAIVRATRQ
jgi:uncharacterized membrane protein YvbJ